MFENKEKSCHCNLTGINLPVKIKQASEVHALVSGQVRTATIHVYIQHRIEDLLQKITSGIATITFLEAPASVEKVSIQIYKDSMQRLFKSSLGSFLYMYLFIY